MSEYDYVVLVVKFIKKCIWRMCMKYAFVLDVSRFFCQERNSINRLICMQNECNIQLYLRVFSRKSVLQHDHRQPVSQKCCEVFTVFSGAFDLRQR